MRSVSSKNIVCKMAAILSRPHCLKWFSSSGIKARTSGLGSFWCTEKNHLCACLRKFAYLAPKKIRLLCFLPGPKIYQDKMKNVLNMINQPLNITDFGLKIINLDHLALCLTYSSWLAVGGFAATTQTEACWLWKRGICCSNLLL